MASTPPTKDERDANLDALKKATEKWVEIEKKRLEEEITFMRAVLKGRTGSDDLTTKNLGVGEALTQVEIDQFVIHAAEGTSVAL